MRLLFVSGGAVVGDASIAEGQPATISGPAGSISVPVRDDDPAGMGWLYDAETRAFSAPLPTYRTLMTPIRFKAQFSVQEQVAIKRARTYVDGADPTPAGDAQKAFTRD